MCSPTGREVDGLKRCGEEKSSSIHQRCVGRYTYKEILGRVVVGIMVCLEIPRVSEAPKCFISFVVEGDDEVTNITEVNRVCTCRVSRRNMIGTPQTHRLIVLLVRDQETHSSGVCGWGLRFLEAETINSCGFEMQLVDRTALCNFNELGCQISLGVVRLAGKAEEGKGRGGGEGGKGGRGKDASQTFKHKESSVVFLEGNMARIVVNRLTSNVKSFVRLAWREILCLSIWEDWLKMNQSLSITWIGDDSSVAILAGAGSV